MRRGLLDLRPMSQRGTHCSTDGVAEYVAKLIVQRGYLSGIQGRHAHPFIVMSDGLRLLGHSIR